MPITREAAQILASAYACFEVAKHTGLTGQPLAICAQNLIGAQKEAGVFMADLVTLEHTSNGVRPIGWPPVPLDLACREKLEQIAGFTTYSMDSSDDKLEDALSTLNRLIYDARKVFGMPESLEGDEHGEG